MMHKSWRNIEEVPYCFSRSSVKFQGHTRQNIADFDLNWAFSDCNLSMNLPMALEWCKELNVAQKGCPTVFQGHPSNFKVTRLKKSLILTQIGCCRTVTPVRDHWWLWNYAQILKQHRRGALLFFKVICQISRSHQTKHRRFWPELGVFGL